MVQLKTSNLSMKDLCQPHKYVVFICMVSQKILETNHALLPHVARLEFDGQSLKIQINLLPSQKSLSNIETAFFSAQTIKKKLRLE